jgi:hypothetical protein
MLDFAADAPMPTPMPGTNLSLEDINPAIVVHSPPVVSATTHISQEPPSYFDIPRSDNITVESGNNTTTDAGITTATAGSSRIGNSDACDGKSASTAEQLIVPSLPAQPPKASVVDYTGDIISWHHPRVDRKQGSESSDEAGNHDYCTLRYRRANGLVAERRIFFPACDESHEYAKGGSNSGDYDYAAWDSMSSATGASGSNDLQRRRSTWSRHTGLYDGTGYGDDTPLTSEPGSPSDAGTSDMRGQYWPCSVGKQLVSSKDDGKLPGVSITHSDGNDRIAGLERKPASVA